LVPGGERHVEFAERGPAQTAQKRAHATAVPHAPGGSTAFVVGATPNAFRRIGVITGGSFEGERLSGEVLNGGNDWQSVRNDGCTKLNVRILLRTTDSNLIVMTYDHGEDG
jgi:hypothetical protein